MIRCIGHLSTLPRWHTLEESRLQRLSMIRCTSQHFASDACVLISNTKLLCDSEKLKSLTNRTYCFDLSLLASYVSGNYIMQYQFISKFGYKMNAFGSF